MSKADVSSLNARINRRSFLKMSALGAAAFGASNLLAQGSSVREATSDEIKNPYPNSKKVKTICTICSAGCGVIAEVHNGVWVRQESAHDHPISEGSHCCKGTDQIDLVKSKQRIKYPMKKENGKWQRLSWEQAINEISSKMLAIREENGPDSVMFLGSAKFNIQQCFYFRKFAAMWGTNNIDHVARVCHSASVAGAANTWGYGAMTNHFGDVVENSKLILMIGANSAVANPIGFKHFLQAKDRGAKLIVVDPVYTKSAAKADIYLRIRTGTDIAFAYGLLHIIFKNGWEDKEFIKNRTYGIEDIRKEALKWTPEVTSDVTGIPVEKLELVAKLYATSKPACIAWSLGITQHSVGSSNTRILPILSLVTGNAARPGGGCNIIRGHDNVQGSTDMGNIADTLPGYYGLDDNAWEYYAKTWGVSLEWLKSRFYSQEWMNAKGFSLSKWWQGVLNNESTYSSSPIRVLWVQGTGITSMSQQIKIKEAIDKLDLMVIAEPFVNEAAIIADKKDGIYILPVATQFETEGVVTATNRSGQWRSQVVKPMYESKEDQEVMFEFAKKFGFFDEYVQGMKVKVNKGEVVRHKDDWVWPDDAMREIARSVKSIGLSGWTPERLRKHQENWHLFDPITLKGRGEMAGEYYALPWPCWDEQHPGTPILWYTGIPVNEGGMGFRNRFGLKHNGVSQIADESVTVKGSKIKGGYPQITKENIEKVLGIKLTNEERAQMGVNWSMDLSGIIQQKCRDAGVCVFGNARARAIVWEFPDQIPLHREPIHSPRWDLVQKYPTFPDQENNFRVFTRYKSEQQAKDWSQEFPTMIVSMRIVNLSGAGMLERTSKYLSSITPEMFCNIHPELASKYGIDDRDMMWIHSPHGTKIKVRAYYNKSVTPDRICMPYNFAGIMQGVDLSERYPEGTKPYTIGESVNIITNYGFDIITQIPEYNAGLCRIEKA
ncbi:MAG: molybdopterin-dependent oxidoreductase [Campylobacteraceae bacterium]|jgi:formate dehydrogenase major subunit|nr:molybdopterin-dependent oxidoreductase [Campylobacteraceae bacterium]